MSPTEYSTDGGNTWHSINSAVMVIFREVVEDADGELQDLHVGITHEGMIFDLVDRESGLVRKTACKLATDIPEELV